MTKRDETMVVEYDRTGGTDVLAKRARPMPAASRDEALVEVIAAGINHIDGFIRSGREATWTDEPFPRGSGSDFAGIVVSGDAGGRFHKGDEVIGHLRQG